MPVTAEAPINTYAAADELFDPEGDDPIEQVVAPEEELTEADVKETLETAKEISAPKEESEKAEEEAKQQEQPEIDSGLKDLLGRAEEYGYSKEEAELLGPDVLRRAMAAVDKQLAAIGKQSWEARRAEETTAKTSEKPVEKTAQQPSESSLRLSEEEVDPAIAKFSGSVEERFARLEQELQAVKAENEKLRQPVQRSQEREASELESKMDSFFAGLGDEYGDLFGKGSLRDLNPGGSSAKARMDVWIQMNALHDGYLKAGRTPPSFEQLQQRALSSLHPDKIKIQARKEVEKKVAARKASSVAKPTSKSGKPLSAVERAVQFASKYYAERGEPEDEDV